MVILEPVRSKNGRCRKGKDLTCDEIRVRCSRLQSSDPMERSKAYGWLVSSSPFMAVVHELSGHQLSLNDVAGLLAEDSSGAIAELALKRLRAAIRAEAEARRVS